jgi:hypothetical protein
MNERVSPKDSEVAAMVTASEALDAKNLADGLESQLRREPFWRFRRRRRLGQDLAVARKVEHAAISVMGGRQQRAR